MMDSRRQTERSHSVRATIYQSYFVVRRWLYRPDITIQERQRFLRQPENMNGSIWGYGLLIGFFVLLLSLIMLSSAAILIFGIWPMHFPIIAATLLIGLYLLTPLALGQPIGRNVWSVVLITLAPYSIVLLLAIAILVVFAILDQCCSRS